MILMNECSNFNKDSSFYNIFPQEYINPFHLLQFYNCLISDTTHMEGKIDN